jgi:hypothetical protein
MTSFEFDLVRGLLTMNSPGSPARTLPLPSELFGPGSSIENITRVRAFTDLGQIHLTLATNDDVIVELPSSPAASDARRPVRPIVYLDQNQWSILAAARFGHRAVSSGVKRAAGQLIELVEAGRVLVPASSAHFTETVPLYGTSRVAIATTILQISRGWQMRSPLDVRLDEIRAAIGGSEPTVGDVFAPQAAEFLGTPSDLGGLADGSAVARVLGVIPSILGLYDTLLETTPIPDEGSVAETQAYGWAQKWAELSEQLHANNEPVSAVMRITTAAMIDDAIDDVERAARSANMTPEQVGARLVGVDDPVAGMPFLGQMRQMLLFRLRNRTQRWEANDLIDILFLCCAAGYADIVVAERQAVSYLRQARTPPPSARLATGLEAAVALLTADRNDDTPPAG